MRGCKADTGQQRTSLWSCTYDCATMHTTKQRTDTTSTKTRMRKMTITMMVMVVLVVMMMNINLHGHESEYGCAGNRLAGYAVI